jgi:hypothetical protein
MDPNACMALLLAAIQEHRHDDAKEHGGGQGSSVRPQHLPSEADRISSG